MVVTERTDARASVHGYEVGRRTSASVYGLKERKGHGLTSTFPVFKTLVTLGMMCTTSYNAPKRLGNSFREQGPDAAPRPS